MTNNIRFESNKIETQINKSNTSNNVPNVLDKRIQNVGQSTILSIPETSSAEVKLASFTNFDGAISRIPTELLEGIFNYIVSEKDCLSLRLVNHQFKEVVDDLFKVNWNNLKKSVPKGIIDLKDLMELIEKRFPNETHFLLFEKLKKEFSHLGAALSNGKLPITISDFEELQNQAAKIAYEHAFFTMWNEVKKNIVNPPTLNTAEEIKNWLNDPNNSNILNQLTVLNLCRRNLQVLPKEIEKFTQLQKLFLHGNFFQFLPESIGSLKNLQYLGLGWNKLKVLPKMICSLENLQGLDLNCNELESLPDSFGSLGHLQKIRLDYNMLKALPDSIGLLKNLQEFNLYYNELNSLPESIGSLVNLTHFDLEKNELQFLPESIESLKKLQVLVLNTNQLQCLPESIGSLEQLQRLELQQNQLQYLPESIGSLEQLQSLLLSSNSLQSLPKSLILLKNLGILFLTANPLMFIPNEILKSDNHCLRYSCRIVQYRDEMQYKSKSSLAKLYQSIIKREDKVQIQKLFSALESEDKNLILEKVRFETNCPQSNDAQWGEHYLLNDMNHFCLVVKKTIESKYEHLEKDQIEIVRRNIYQLAGSPMLSDSIIDVSEWVRWHALSNYPRLADAIAKLKTKNKIQKYFSKYF